MDSQKIKVILVVIFAAFAAVYLGVAAATNQTEALAWIIGAVGVVFILSLGHKVWMLIPAGLLLQGTVNAFPGSPPVWAFGALIAFGIFAMRFALRKPDFVLRLDLMDFAVIFNLLAIVQAYLRNPTSFLMLGGELAGGKPYAVFAVAIMAYFFLSALRTDLSSYRLAIIVMVCVTLADGLLGVAADWIPPIAAFVLPIYSNVNFGVAQAGEAFQVDFSEMRGGASFGFLGRTIALTLLCFSRPIRCLLPTHPVRLLLFILAASMILLSGFRSLTVYVLVVYVTVALVRRNFMDIGAVVIAAFFGIAILSLAGFSDKLPFGAQRVLSVIPFVPVDTKAKLDADQSSEWRFEMWRIALTSERYIQNKMLGDGFAMSAREMRAQLDAAQGFGDGSTDQDRIEGFMLRGSYHGFHVETIRFTGVVGLFAAVFAMFVFMRKAWQLLAHYRGQPIFGFVAFIAIPFVIQPFWSLLVFGSYRSDFPQFLVAAGLLKMLDTLRRQELASAAALPLQGAEYTPASQRFRGRLDRPDQPSIPLRQG
jgi:hypothetical protein